MVFKHGVRWTVGLLVAALVVGLAGGPGIAFARPNAQAGENELLLLGSLNATLDATTPEVTATFYVEEGFPFSLDAFALSGDLTTTMTITGPGGQVVATAGPDAFDPTITFVEALLAPQAGTYTATVSRVGASAGDVALDLLTGYAVLDVWDDFESGDPDYNLTWSPYAASSSDGSVVNGEAMVHVASPNTLSYYLPDDDLSWGDLYIEADVRIEGQPSYYEYGFNLRQNRDNDTYYSLTVSSDGDWNLFFHDASSEWIEIQPWTVSPVINGADLNPRIAVLVQGNTFRLYFNDQFVDEVTDTANYASEGAFALSAATLVDQPDEVTVYFDNLALTSPAGASGGVEEPDTVGATKTPQAGVIATPTPGVPFGGQPTKVPSNGLVIPTATPQAKPTTSGFSIPTATPSSLQGGLTIPTATPELGANPGGGDLTTWTSGDPVAIVTELQQLGRAPAGGTLAMTVPTSFGDASASGYYPLGQGQNFGDLALGFDASLPITGPESGCGMRFHDTGASRALALVTEDGAAVLAQLDGTDFHPASFYDYSPAVNAGQGAVNNVVVTAVGSAMALFVNGQLVAEGTFAPGQGRSALELFVAEDDAGNRQRTYCQLDNIWVWTF